MLAYLSWHRPAAKVEREDYERALERFHRSLAYRPPSGFRGSVCFRAAELPWLSRGSERDASADADGEVAAGAHVEAPGAYPPAGYEDWYLLDGWSTVGVLEEATISRGHRTAHAAIAQLTGPATSAVYRLVEGHAAPAAAELAVWVGRERGYESPTMADLLGDGMDRTRGGLWRRCLGLGPAPEFCLLAGAGDALAGVTPARLPRGWSATTYPREVLWNG